MSVFLVLLSCLVLTVCGKNEQNITLTFVREVKDGISKLVCVNKDQFNLMEEIPIMMYINKPSNTEITLEKFECYIHNDSSVKLVFGDLSSNEHYFNVPILNVSSIMNDIYECYFLMNKNMDTQIQPQIMHDGALHVLIKIKFRVAIKYQKSLNVEINGNVMDNEPVFESDEVDAKVMYKFVSDELLNIKCIRSYNMNGTIQFIYNADKPYTSVPSTEANIDFQVILKPYHDGIHIDCIFDTESVKTVLRVYMVLEQKHVENFVRVNGLAIRQREDILKYYYIGDVPSVSCPGRWEEKACHGSCGDVKSHGECTIKGKVTKIQKFEDYARNGIYILGLIDKKIIFQTYENGGKSRIIYYECNADDVLTLNPLYVNEKEDVFCKINGLSSDGKAEKSLTLRLREDYNTTNVTCETSLFKTHILFYYVKSIAEKKPPLNNVSPNNAVKNDYYLFKVMIIPGILLIVLLLGMAIAFRKIRDSIGEEEQTEQAMDNTRNKPNSQFPKRLNTNVYIRPVKKTVVSAAREPTKSYYSKNRVSINELNYAELQFSNAANDNTNSDIHPAEQRSIYSEVHHVQPSSLYAEVVHIDHNVNYDNCFNGSDYANANTDDYVSSYCCGDDYSASCD